MSERFAGYTEVLDALVSEAISCTPAGWDKGTLTIECDGSYMNYKLKNEESPDKAQISENLRGLCEELYVVMRQAGDIWLMAKIRFFREGGGWSFDADFKYPKPGPAGGPPLPL